MITKERKNGLVMLKLFFRKLQNHLQMSRRLQDGVLRGFLYDQEVEEKEMVPNDVKQGHFAVLAAKSEKGKEPTRFVVDLCVLNNPKFLRMLELAEEEYGFQQNGTLAVPCEADELRRILQDKEWKSDNAIRDFSSTKCILI